MFYYELVVERRANPQDDMISRLTEVDVARDDGVAKLTDAEIAAFAMMLGGAGAETVVKLIGNAAVTFAANPDQWRRLGEDGAKSPTHSKSCFDTRRRRNTSSATPRAT